MPQRTTDESTLTGVSEPADPNGIASEDVSSPPPDDQDAESPAPPTVEVHVEVDGLGRGRGSAEDDAEADADAEVRADADADADAEDGAEDVAAGQGEDEACPQQSLTVRVEALLFASDRPLTERRLAQLCGLPAAGATARVRDALAELDGFLRATGRSFRPRKVAGGWQLVSLPVFGPLMARLHRDRQETRLSPAAMETLAIIAYRQPVLRAELEAIRGVACGEVLRSLLERRMISIVGRAEELGRPMLYGTTKQFLDVFGISSLDDLPEVAGLDRRRVERPARSDDPETADDPTQTAAAPDTAGESGVQIAADADGAVADVAGTESGVDADADAEMVEVGVTDDAAAEANRTDESRGGAL
jgi:segregation and condensation protein B